MTIADDCMTGRVGFIGLGDIGKPMAGQLVKWPGGLSVFDVVSSPVEELVAKGARAAQSVAELAAECSVICIMVRTDDQVIDVMGEIFGAARPGTVIAVHSTISSTFRHGWRTWRLVMTCCSPTHLSAEGRWVPRPARLRSCSEAARRPSPRSNSRFG
ncbi:hypothetical protein GCM10027600_02000 [Nocardioides ginsengisegetis]|uniref:NAD(P)-binding domain-containing protein n=1 Tax=Nocardioides ginsengisegetis TaxID=661491 RepID=UPI001C724E44